MEKQEPPPAYQQPPPPPQGYGAPPPTYTLPPGQPAPAGYPQQPPHPAGYAPAPPPTHQYALPPQQTVVMSNVNQRMSENPMSMHCPQCQANIVTRVEYTTGMLTWLVMLGLLVMGCFLGCCLIPLCVDGLKDVNHFCPNCNHMIGRKERLS